MKLFLQGWANEQYHIFLGHLFQDRELEIVGFVDSNINNETSKEFNKSKPDIKVGSWEQCIYTDYYPLLKLEGIKIWQSISKSDCIILDKLYMRTIHGKKSLHTKELLIQNLIQWYYNLLDETQPDIIILPEIPHAFGDYILKIVAEKKKIKVICFKTMVAGKYLWRAYDLCEEKHIEVAQMTTYNARKERKIIREIYERSSNLAVLPYSNKHAKAIKSTGRKAVAEIRNQLHHDTELLVSIEQMINRKKRYYSEYKDGINNKEKNRCILFLHYEPEANLAPFGTYYSDQLAFANIINSFCQLNDLELYIRDHPDQFKIPASGYNVNRHWIETENINPRNDLFDKKLENLSEFKGFVNSVLLKDEFKKPECRVIASVNGNILAQGAIAGKLAISGCSFWGESLANIHYIDNILNNKIDLPMTDHIDIDMFEMQLSNYLFDGSYFNCDKGEYSPHEISKFISKLSIFLKQLLCV